MHPRERRLQRVVVGWQVSVAVVLLAGAALFVRSVQTLDRTDVGFLADRLLSIAIEPSWKELERWDTFYDTLLFRTHKISSIARCKRGILPATQQANWERFDSRSFPVRKGWPTTPHGKRTRVPISKRLHPATFERLELRC